MLQCSQAVYDCSSYRKCASVGKWKIEVWLLPPQQAPHKSIPVTQPCLPRLLMGLLTTTLLPSTPTREKSQAHYSAQLANGLGVPSSLFMAHLAPVRWWCHVHSGMVSLNGVDTERWGRDASQERLFSLFMLIHIRIQSDLIRDARTESSGAEEKVNEKAPVPIVLLRREMHLTFF